MCWINNDGTYGGRLGQYHYTECSVKKLDGEISKEDVWFTFKNGMDISVKTEYEI